VSMFRFLCVSANQTSESLSNVPIRNWRVRRSSSLGPWSQPGGSCPRVPLNHMLCRIKNSGQVAENVSAEISGVSEPICERRISLPRQRRTLALRRWSFGQHAG
jgi:hypothetical protein